MNCLEGTKSRSRLPWPGDCGGVLHAHVFPSAILSFGSVTLGKSRVKLRAWSASGKIGRDIGGNQPMSDELPTAARVSDPGIRALYQLENRWQAWLDVEAALAKAQEELGIIPAGAAEAIGRAARLELLDHARIDEGFARTGHTIVPLVWELSRVTGEPHGGWVHWGATTQNITQTGDLLVLRQAHGIILKLIGEALSAMADLAERGAEMPMAGRTHGQHAVPATFGYKVAVWIDELLRHVERLRQAAPRLFVAMLGGGAGTFASLGKQGPPVQAGIGRQLGFGTMT